VAASSGVSAENRVTDLDPRYYKRIDQLQKRFPHGAPSLVDCRRLTVRGDVHFGSGVVCRGDVTVAHQDEPRLIADDTVLD